MFIFIHVLTFIFRYMLLWLVFWRENNKNPKWFAMDRQDRSVSMLVLFKHKIYCVLSIQSSILYLNICHILFADVIIREEYWKRIHWKIKELWIVWTHIIKLLKKLLWRLKPEGRKLKQELLMKREV